MKRTEKTKLYICITEVNTDEDNETIDCPKVGQIVQVTNYIEDNLIEVLGYDKHYFRRENFKKLGLFKLLYIYFGKVN